jgi:hypothetical protein
MGRQGIREAGDTEEQGKDIVLKFQIPNSKSQINHNDQDEKCQAIKKFFSSFLLPIGEKKR